MLVARSLLSCAQVAALPLCLRVAATWLRTATSTTSTSTNTSAADGKGSADRRIYNTADLCDEHEDKLSSGELAVLAIPFRSFGGRTAFHGQAKTIKCFENNPLVRQTLQQPGDNRVLVVDGGGSTNCALLGDNLASIAHANQWAGVIIHGCVRDTAQLKTIGVGIFAVGTHPKKSGKAQEGCADEVLLLGDVQVKSGDWIYADEDGVLVAASRLHND